jgi:hypothetical protein
MKEIRRTIESKVKPDLLKRFEEIVADWDTKIKFIAKTTVTSNSISVSVRPAGRNAKIWRFVSEGTKPHKIRPKNAKVLAFVWGGKGSYVPKTKPIGQFGGPGRVTNGTLRFFPEVNHPGNKARQFEKAIAKKEERRFQGFITQAIRRGRQRA